MKKLSVLLLAILASVQVFAQNTMEDLYAGKTNLVFLGLDFTHAKYIGRAGFTDVDAILNRHMVSWNDLIEMEPKKYSLESPLGLQPGKSSSKVMDMIDWNKKANVKDNITNDDYTLSEDEVKKGVAKYSLKSKEGVGMVYVVESLNKLAEKMTAYAVFIDLPTKKILKIEKIEGKAQGFGFRNYWAGAVAKANSNLGARYKMWSRGGN